MKNRATPAGSCSPAAVQSVSKQYKRRDPLRAISYSLKKWIASILALVFALALVGCNRLLIKKENVKNISVSSDPSGYEYAFQGDDAQAIIDYLTSLNLIPHHGNFDDVGMSWHISIEYENGNTVRVYHNCNKYVQMNDGSWYQITFEEADRFSALLEELNQ